MKKHYFNHSIISGKGFTFVELLIVALLLPVISLAIYSTFNSGVKIWQRTQKGIPEEDIYIFFDKFDSDLKNSFRFGDTGFTGKEDNLEFYSLVYAQRLEKRTVGQISYFYDYTKETFNRAQRDFAQLYSAESFTITQSLPGIKSLRFHYYLYDEQSEEYCWQDECSGETLPLVVRVELNFDDDIHENEFVKTVRIPAGD